MIYVFTCVRQLFALPGVLCNECSKVCQYINCAPIQQCCYEVSRCFASFIDRPLSSFVIIAALLSLCELLYCAYSFKEPFLGSCAMTSRMGSSIGIVTWLYVQIGFACLNLLFAPYFQCKVWRHIVQEIQNVGPMPLGHVRVSMKSVQEAFKQVFLHDFGVLFYFFALIASFVWSSAGAAAIDHGWNCNPGGYPGQAAWLGMCFFWTACVYSVLWYCCECCARSVDIMGCGGGILPSGGTTTSVPQQGGFAPGVLAPVYWGIPGHLSYQPAVHGPLVGPVTPVHPFQVQPFQVRGAPVQHSSGILTNSLR